MHNLYWTLKFILNNKNKYLNNNNKKKIVLIELFNYKASIISNSIFANELAKIKKAKIVGYEPYFSDYKKNIKRFFSKFNIFSHYSLYKSFGIDTLIIPKKNPSLVEIDLIFKKIMKKVKSKKDILKIKIYTILIGDLIYDGFLRENRLSTIDVESNIFHQYLKRSIELFLYWHDYFNKNNVEGIVLSHSVYLTAIPVRIACQKKIKVFNVGFSSVYRLTKSKPLKFSYFKEYPEIFNSFSSNIKSKLINNSKKNIKLRLSGKKDLLYKQSQPLKEIVYSKINIKKNLKKKIILIAAHDFTDAPHVHGKMLFTDFYEWIDYLGKKSKQFNEYNWFIKLHPAEYDENLHHVKAFLNKYPTLKLLPKNINHNELLSRGVKCVLTTYGSIAHEYPFFGVPVINAGENPHSGYKFSITPINFQKYHYLINNLDTIKLQKKFINKIYEFYSMYHLVDYNIFEELEFSEKKLNTYFIFKYFKKKFSNPKINKIEKDYSRFIKSKKRRLIKFL